MNYKNILALTLLVVVVGVFTLLQTRPWEVYGSVDTDAGGYNATTTNAAMGSGVRVLRNTPGMLGSVVVTLTSNAPLRIYDATTTGAYVYNASSTIADFKTTPAGTYTFDVTAKRGIVIETTSTVGVASTTVTWK